MAGQRGAERLDEDVCAHACHAATQNGAGDSTREYQRRSDRMRDAGVCIDALQCNSQARIFPAACRSSKALTTWEKSVTPFGQCSLRLAVEPSQIRWRKRPGLRAIEKLLVLERAADAPSLSIFLDAPAISHKTEAGGVLLNLAPRHGLWRS